MNYLLHLATIFGLYLLLAYSLNLTVGYCGLLSFCHAAFYGVGAYTYALLALNLHISFLGAVLCAALVTTGLGAAIAVPALRFRGDLFVFVTIAYQIIVFTILYNWIDFTGGPAGLDSIPRPELFGLKITSPGSYLALVIATNLVVLPLMFALYRSPFGLTLRALREDERAAMTIRISPVKRYVQAMAISAGVAAVPGALYASYVTYIDPSSFTLQESIFQVAILLLGGAGNRLGPLMGVTFLTMLPAGLRFLGLPDAVGANVREILYGALLVGLMYARPKGIAGEYEIR